ncbi:MAG: PH domain-containing protein [bacterium]|nr:PH domain-containing protein [bacterium]
MLKLNENEKILLIIRKHWFVVARTVFLFILLLLIPTIVLTVMQFSPDNFDNDIAGPITNLFLSVYSMVLLLFLFLFWMDYYLDMWVITNDRIIDIEQRGLFYRNISEIPMQHVQDVTIEVHGVIETFLKFGTIRIQTAGEREFTINMVPHLYEAKDLILQYANKLQRDIKS